MERVTLYFQVNDVAEGKQVTMFLSAMGPKTYVLLRSKIHTTGRNS